MIAEQFLAGGIGKARDVFPKLIQQGRPDGAQLRQVRPVAVVGKRVYGAATEACQPNAVGVIDVLQRMQHALVRHVQVAAQFLVVQLVYRIENLFSSPDRVVKVIN